MFISWPLGHHWGFFFLVKQLFPWSSIELYVLQSGFFLLIFYSSTQVTFKMLCFGSTLTLTDRFSFRKINWASIEKTPHHHIPLSSLLICQTAGLTAISAVSCWSPETVQERREASTGKVSSQPSLEGGRLWFCILGCVSSCFFEKPSWLWCSCKPAMSQSWFSLHVKSVW